MSSIETGVDFDFNADPNLDEEKQEVVTNSDLLKILKFSPVNPRAFTEHGAIMASRGMLHRFFTEHIALQAALIHHNIG